MEERSINNAQNSQLQSLPVLLFTCPDLRPPPFKMAELLRLRPDRILTLLALKAFLACSNGMARTSNEPPQSLWNIQQTAMSCQMAHHDPLVNGVQPRHAVQEKEQLELLWTRVYRSFALNAGGSMNRIIGLWYIGIVSTVDGWMTRFKVEQELISLSFCLVEAFLSPILNFPRH